MFAGQTAIMKCQKFASSGDFYSKFRRGKWIHKKASKTSGVVPRQRVKQIFTSFHNFIAKQMKKRNINKRLLGVGLFFCLFFKNSSAQLALSASIRTRGDIRYGSSTPKLLCAVPFGSMPQRVRPAFNDKLEKRDFGMSIQDAQRWGQAASMIHWSKWYKIRLA
ncbi:MAG: hypothetical protein RLZZ628_1412 [Bacteroidota bacterium]|jgi:hypothetical protein